MAETSAVRTANDPWRAFGQLMADAARGLAIEDGRADDVFAGIYDAEVDRRVAAHQLIRSDAGDFPDLQLIAKDRLAQMVGAIGAALEALEEDDIDAAFDALEPFRNDEPEEEPDQPAAPAAAKKVPAKKAAAKKTPAKKVPAKRAARKKAAAKKAAGRRAAGRKKNVLPSTDGSPVPCTECGTDVALDQQLISAARTKATPEGERVLCRDHFNTADFGDDDA